MNTIKWVSEDTLSTLDFTLKDANTGDPCDPDTWDALDVSGYTISMPFRKKGTTTLIDTLTGSFVTDGTDGKITYTMTATAADNPAGQYEGEIVLTSGSDTFTVYDTVEFLFRLRF